MLGKQFVYTSYDVDNERTLLTFRYQIITDEQQFDLNETLKLQKPLPDTPAIQNTLRALHIALGVSYYKAYIPPEIIHPYGMGSGEADFWNTVFEHGLGEFLYTNKLSADRLAHFQQQEGHEQPAPSTEQLQATAMLGVGGGKDSIVAGELLKKLNTPTTGFVLATLTNRGQTQAVVEKMGVDLSAVERRLDPQILQINAMPGAYNGHVPISLIFALVGCLLALQNSSMYVVVANEASASIPHVTTSDGSVNHQWSKSFAFETLFQAYVHEHISPQLQYVSLIRQLSSVAVAKLFAKFPDYFETFTSDNSLFKIKPEQREHPRWSSDSPKSLSSYILLAPWMSDDDLLRAFGRDFLDKQDSEDMLLALLGAADNVVLDCVGTPAELVLSLSLLNQQNRAQDSQLMRTAKDRGLLLAQDTDNTLATHLALSDEHALPPQLQQQLEPLLEGLLS